MLSFDEKELEFAQKYPFSPAAKSIVKNSGFSLEEVPRSVLARARSMVASAYARHDYSPKIREAKELLVDEVLAFPVSKILVSAIDSFELNRKFASMVSSSVFRNLEGEKAEIALYSLLDSLRVIAILLLPFIPQTAERISKQLNAPLGNLGDVKFGLLKAGTKLGSREILFKKIETKK